MNNLKNIREIYGITQDEIAKAINVNRDYLFQFLFDVLRYSQAFAELCR